MLYLVREEAPGRFLIGAWNAKGYGMVVEAEDPAEAAVLVDGGVLGEKASIPYKDLPPEWAVIQGMPRRGCVSLTAFLARPIQDLVLVEVEKHIATILARGMEALHRALKLGLRVDVGVPGMILDFCVGEKSDYRESYELGFEEGV